MLFVIESLHRYPFYDLLTPLTSVLIALLLDCGDVPGTAVGRFLNLPPLMYIGLFELLDLPLATDLPPQSLGHALV